MIQTNMNPTTFTTPPCVLEESSNVSLSGIVCSNVTIGVPIVDNSELVAASEATRIATSVLIALIMFGFGCSVEPKKALAYCKKPKQFITALALQLLGMPLLGFGLSQAFSMTPPEAAGVYIQASCPGGTYSNLAAYWVDGDLNLSVLMTTMSTILAMGTLPLWLFLFPLMGKTGDILKVPFDQLGYALLGIIPPLLVGIPVNYKFPKRAPLITKICTTSGFVGFALMAIILIATQKVKYVVSWRQIVVLLLFPSIGGIVGYLATRLPWLDYNVAQRRTVAIETAMQNTALGVSIVLISFSLTLPEFGTILVFPVFYGGLQLISIFPMVAIYRFLKWKGYKCVLPTEDSDEEDSTELEERTENGVSNLAFSEDGAITENGAKIPI